MLHSLLVLFRLFKFSWLLLVLDLCKYGPGKSWKSPGILMDLWCTNPEATKEIITPLFLSTSVVFGGGRVGVEVVAY